MTDIFDVTLSPLHPTVEEDHCAGLQSQLSTAFKVCFTPLVALTSRLRPRSGHIDN